MRACGVRIVREICVSRTFRGAEAVIWTVRSALSVSAMGVSGCKSEDGSEVRRAA